MKSESLTDLSHSTKQLSQLSRAFKSKEQIKTIQRLLKTHLEMGITTFPKALRDQVMAETGLKWSQVYKWVFDQGQKYHVTQRKLEIIFRIETVHRVSKPVRKI